MKKHLHVLALLLVAVMLVSALAGCGGSGSSTPASGSGSTSAGEPADANPNAGRETVNIRFAQFGNSVDDVDGMENDPIKKAIEEAVNVTLEYDTGTDGFDERMQTELFTGGAADLFPTWGESEKISKWAEEDLVVNIAEIVNAEPDRYPTLYKIINSDEYKVTTSCTRATRKRRLCHLFRGRVCGPQLCRCARVQYCDSERSERRQSARHGGGIHRFHQGVRRGRLCRLVAPQRQADQLGSRLTPRSAAPQGTSILPPTGDVWSGFVPSGEIGTDSEHWTLATVSDEAKEVVKQLAEMYAAGGLDSGIGVKSDFDDAYSDFGAGKIASRTSALVIRASSATFIKQPGPLPTTARR